MEHYEVLAPIAAALFGRVDRCRHRASGATVAVKRMELRFAGRRRAKHTNAAVLEDVHAELQANLKVQALGGHRFVLPMTDCFVEDDAVHLVLAHCARGELLSVVNATRAAATLPAAVATRRTLRYFKQVLLATAFLHVNGIAHRDLSLENVLVDERDCCQVCDFGLATSAAAVQATPVGKVRYMAPEACAAPESETWYSPIAADVWSLGVMLFAMLAGRFPFREPLRRDDQFRLLEDFGVAYLLAKLDVEVEPALANLLAQCFVLDPEVRPSVATLLQHRALADVDVDSDSDNSEVTVSSNQSNQSDATLAKTAPVITTTTTTTTNRAATSPAGALQALLAPLRPASALVSKQQTPSSTPCAVLTPCVSTIHPAAKHTAAKHTAGSKALEISQPEVAESRVCAAGASVAAKATGSTTATTSSMPTATRREVVQRALGKMFRKASVA